MKTILPSKSHLVSIQRNTYDALDIPNLIQPLGGLRHFLQKGERVLLKTSLLIPSDPKKAVVTHPAVIRALAEAALQIGAVPFIGDSPSGQFTKRRLEKAYQKSGLTTVANDLGIELNYDTGITKIEIPQAKKLKKTPICDYVLHAEKIVAVPKIKTHSYMIMTLATKIMYGAVPGLTKAKYHSLFIRRTAFADMLLDVLSVKKPTLIIMDGITGMEGDGPSGGTPVDLGVLMASQNPVALDLAVCDMLGIEPMHIPTLRQAKIRRLWPAEIRYPLLSPQDVRYTGFHLPSSAVSLFSGPKKHRQRPIPTEKCTACGECVDICPKHAIQIKEQRASVDYTKCIACYCCHEICPYEAIKLDHLS
ncbi:MAG: DUF362 domain-containing protein [Candidatus Thermoplasmatota archaeon]|nr:DUF362 domain-containing protein [Candidatus Thermoplasmatota archaeon]